MLVFADLNAEMLENCCAWFDFNCLTSFQLQSFVNRSGRILLLLLNRKQ